MDLHKWANVDYLTAWDLDSQCVRYRHKTRRKMMKIANRLARRRLKYELMKDNLYYLYQKHSG